MQARSIAVAERRAFSRREVTWQIRLLRAGGEYCEAVCTDVGSSGVGFQTMAVLHAGEIVHLEFPGGGGDGDGRHPAVRAQIIYRIGDQYGASFVSTCD